MEIGFGGGENVSESAIRNPRTGIIGSDPFLAGVGKLLSRISVARIDNIRIFPGDVRDLLPALPQACISKLFVLFPDPWPKKRHRKRRLFQRSFIHSLARISTPNGEVIVATDNDAYKRWVLELFLESPFFSWEAKKAEDWRCRPADVVCTRYENKARREGRHSTFLKFRRNDVIGCFDKEYREIVTA